MNSFNGRTAVVTGGSRGIGRAIALELARRGAAIAIFDRQESEALTATVAEIAALGVRCERYLCDVSDSAAVNAAAEAALRDFGRVDVLVNNAGVTRDKLLMAMTEEDFDFVTDVNLKGTFLTVKAFIRHFVKNRYGRIVNISSVVGLTGNGGQANYVASKAGVIGLTKTVAKEYGPRGITCNAVAPGFIETDMTAVLPPETREAMLKAIPAARPGQVEDVARAVAFLASDEAAYVTGETLRVDGGMAM